ncbi:MAG TPA: hypothetical protein VGT82_04675 [Ktedonobacteraceae bacterium]|nr:hypothetical protein [Ktedonobacteraceae bacterium]
MQEDASITHLFKGWKRYIPIVLLCLLPLFALLEQTTYAHTLVVLHGRTQHHTPQNTAVLTFHNDLFRSGQNLNETILNTKNVNARLFGKRVSYPVDGQIYTQPLFVPNVTIKGRTYNVVYVATENDSVYAFDADQRTASAPLWHTSFIHRPDITPVPPGDVYTSHKNQDLTPHIGITGTPVIDLASGTLYVVAFTLEKGSPVQRLHGLDIRTGKDRPGSPVVIAASMEGKGYDNKNGRITFRADRGNQRAALLLYRGIVYICEAAFGDSDPYHGWILGYDARTYQQVPHAVYSDSPDGQKGGIWMSGAAPAVDNNGYMYLTTGNGDMNLNRGGRNAGDSIVKLDIQHALLVSDYFTPFNQVCLDGRDDDLSSGGVLLLPDQKSSHPHVLVAIGKEGRVYVIEREHMGHFTPDPHLTCNTTEEKRVNVDKILQELPPLTVGRLFGIPAYWSGARNSSDFIYVGGFNDSLRALPILRNGLLASHASSQSPEKFAFSGATPSISSNGNIPDTGIVWVNSPSRCFSPGCNPQGDGVLRAYDATNLGKELYNSQQNAARDRADSYVKFSVPTVANGKVFVGTQTRLDIYGLLAH